MSDQKARRPTTVRTVADEMLNAWEGGQRPTLSQRGFYFGYHALRYKNFIPTTTVATEKKENHQKRLVTRRVVGGVTKELPTANELIVV